MIKKINWTRYYIRHLRTELEVMYVVFRQK